MTGAVTRRDRFPGARPFADDPVDQRLFFGRAREAEQLFHRIAAETLLVVYGKSGLGKTSLLQAGIFPRLRERELLPVPVRLNRPDVDPAGVTQGEDLASPPLRFTDTALSELLAFPEGSGGIIEPFQVQVLCRHLEQRMVRKAQEAPAGELTVAPADLGGPKGMAAVLGNFYRDALDALPERRQRRRARSLCEWGLLSEEGRRLPMEQEQIRRQFRVAPDSLQHLVDARLLRPEPRLEGVFYEFSHDTLAEPVLAHRRWRLPRGAKYALLALLVLLAGAASVPLLTERERKRAEHHAQRAELARSEAEGLIEFMLFDLRDKLAPFGRLDLLRDVQERIDAYYEHLGIDADDLAMQRRRMSALNNKGDTLLARGDLVATSEIYRRAYQIAEGLAASDPSNAGWQRDLYVSLWRLGDAAQRAGDLGQARKHHAQARAIAEKLVETDPTNAEWQRDLVMSLEKASEEGLAEGGAAHGYLQRALEVLEGLEAAGKLHGEHRDWPDRVRQGLQALDPPPN